MTNKCLNKNIIIRKIILNLLLNHFSPTNRFIVALSQNLDTLISKRQRLLYSRYKNRQLKSKVSVSSPKNIILKKIA